MEHHQHVEGLPGVWAASAKAPAPTSPTSSSIQVSKKENSLPWVFAPSQATSPSVLQALPTPSEQISSQSSSSGSNQGSSSSPSPGSSSSPSKSPNSREDQVVRKLIAGGGAGAISRTLTAPLERVKVVLQVQAVSKVPEALKYKGIWDCLTRIGREQGVLAYWRGNGVNVLRIIPNSAIKFTTFDTYKKLAFPEGEAEYKGREKFLRKMFCGALSGVSTIIPVYPLDLARTRLSADTSSRYNGMVHLMQSTIEKEGIAGMYKGLGISLCGIMPYLAISLSTYDTLKDMTQGDPFFSHPLGKVMLGSTAAILSQSLAYPIDTVRRHMQVSGALGQQRLYANTSDCIRKIYASGGARGFYKGLLANASRAAPQTGIEFACYDFIASLLKNTDMPLRTAWRKASGAQIDQVQHLSAAPLRPVNDDHEDIETPLASTLTRRMSSRLPKAEEERIDRVYDRLVNLYGNGHDKEIPTIALREALVKLGFMEYEVDEVLDTNRSHVEVIDFMEFRKLCRDHTILEMLESQSRD